MNKVIQNFSDILYRENEQQNLTRIKKEDFENEHLRDVTELLSLLGEEGERIADLGTGSGVPGLLAAAIDQKSSRKWILIEAEKSKAAFLERAADGLGIKHKIELYPERIESCIAKTKPDIVIARALGSVDKIAGWIQNCSTWNKLILFKSRGWKEEWDAAKKEKFGKKLTVTHIHEYQIQDKYRVLVTLQKK